MEDRGRRRAGGYLSPRLVMSTYFATGGALLLFVAGTPGYPAMSRPLLWAVAAAAAAVAAGLLLVPRLSSAGSQVVLATGSVLIAVVVLAGGGGAPSTAMASFILWVVTWAALFLPTRTALLHGGAALLLTGGCLAVVERHSPPGVLVVLLIAITGSNGLIVAGLMRHTNRLAATDALTGLLSEAGLAAVMARDTAAASEEAPGLLLLIDLDRFGEINQALGRQGGDDLLRQLAESYRTNGGEFGHFARLGGDDFAMWLPRLPVVEEGASAQQAVDVIAGLIAEDSCGPFVVDGIGVEMDFTLGAALVPQHGRDLTTLLQRADTALHAARRTDRQALLWNPELDRASADGLALQAELRAAIADGPLRLHYQPLVDARTNEVAGVEALVRWQHPTRGLLGPAAFLDAAEHSSTIVTLTSWVLAEAIRQAALWQAAGRPLRVSVNLSARLVADDRLARDVDAALRSAGVPPELLMLEVTETAVTMQPARAVATLAEVRAIGVQIALDDFGTGYTSLAMLQDLPFDELKVDRRFVAGALSGDGDLAIVHAVVGLAHQLGFKVVAEGVEDDATRRLLETLGYDLLQGYHFSRPVPSEQIDGLVEARLASPAEPVAAEG